MSAVNTVESGALPLEKSAEGASAILEAAIELFADRGFEAVPLSAIAEKAGVCKANIFHHFGSKELLYGAVMQRACERMARLLEDVTSGAGSFAERVRHFACGHMRNLMSHPTLSRLIVREFLEGNVGRGGLQVERMMGANFAKLVDIIRAGQRAGDVRPELDPAALAVALVAGNTFFFQVRSTLARFPDARSVDDPEAFSRLVVDVFLNGVLANPQPHQGGQGHACAR